MCISVASIDLLRGIRTFFETRLSEEIVVIEHGDGHGEEDDKNVLRENAGTEHWNNLISSYYGR